MLKVFYTKKYLLGKRCMHSYMHLVLEGVRGCHLIYGHWLVFSDTM